MEKALLLGITISVVVPIVALFLLLAMNFLAARTAEEWVVGIFTLIIAVVIRLIRKGLSDRHDN